MVKKSELNELLNAMEKKSNVNLDIVQNYLGEYLKAYFLVGYDNDEGSVFMINGKTEQDFDSLENLMNKFSNIRFNPQEMLKDINNNNEE